MSEVATTPINKAQNVQFGERMLSQVASTTQAIGTEGSCNMHLYLPYQKNT